MKKVLTDEEIVVAHVEYMFGVSIQSIAKKHGCSVAPLYRGFNNLGLEIRGEAVVKKYDLNHNAFENAHLNPEAAYWAGMLAADGHVPSNQVRLGLSAVDSDEIDRFAKFVGYSGDGERTKAKVHIVCGNEVNAGDQRRISVVSKKMASDLHSYGIISPKTKFLKIIGGLEDSLDFWRGVICGDGWLSITKKGDLEIGLGGCHSFIDQYCEFIEKSCSIKSDVREFKSNGTMPFYRVRHSAMNCCKVVKFLFGCEGHALARKKAIAQEIISGIVSDDEYVVRGKSRVAHFDWSKVSKEELIEVRTRLGSWRAVADHYGVNITAIEHVAVAKKIGDTFLTKYGWLTKDMLIQEYKKCRNWVEVAKRLNATERAIHYRIEKYGLRSLDFMEA